VQCIKVFIDDVLVHSKTIDQHILDMGNVLGAPHAVRIPCYPHKCMLDAQTVEYLGHNISVYGLIPHQCKVAGILALKEPTSVTELRTVLVRLPSRLASLPALPLSSVLFVHPAFALPWYLGPPYH